MAEPDQAVGSSVGVLRRAGVWRTLRHEAGNAGGGGQKTECTDPPLCSTGCRECPGLRAVGGSSGRQLGTVTTEARVDHKGWVGGFGLLPENCGCSRRVCIFPSLLWLCRKEQVEGTAGEEAGRPALGDSCPGPGSEGRGPDGR